VNTATVAAPKVYIRRHQKTNGYNRIKEKPVAVMRPIYFSLLFGIIFFSFVAAIFYAQHRFVHLFGWPQITPIVSILIIAFSARPLEGILMDLTDAVLVKKRYPYEKMLIQATKGMVLITDIEKMLNLIGYIVKKYIKARSVAIFQCDGADEGFILKCRRGENRNLTGYRVRHTHPLIKWLKEKETALICNELDRGDFLKEELKKLDCAVCVPSFWKNELIGFLVLGKKASGMVYTKEEGDLLLTLSNGIAVAIENSRNFMELEKLRGVEKENYFQTIMALAQTVDEKDAYTRGHLKDVSYYGMKVAEELQQLEGFKDAVNKEDLGIALRLHDIGKIGVPDAILYKKGKLTRGEFAVMKQHCNIGERIIEPIEKLKNVRRIIKHHQEKYDGSGYPDGLKGENIPLESRIIAVVDAYHAMVSDRPYRKALPKNAAVRELKKNINTQFDPLVVRAFLNARKNGKIKKI